MLLATRRQKKKETHTLNRNKGYEKNTDIKIEIGINNMIFDISQLINLQFLGLERKPFSLLLFLIIKERVRQSTQSIESY